MKGNYINFLTTENTGKERKKETTENTENTEKEGLSFLTGKILGAAIEIHRTLGPGLLESTYEACLIYELNLQKLKVESQKEGIRRLRI